MTPPRPTTEEGRVRLIEHYEHWRYFVDHPLPWELSDTSAGFAVEDANHEVLWRFDHYDRDDVERFVASLNDVVSVKEGQEIRSYNRGWDDATKEAATPAPVGASAMNDPEPTHPWNGMPDGHNCASCAHESIWRCDRPMHPPRPAGRTMPTQAEYEAKAQSIAETLTSHRCPHCHTEHAAAPVPARDVEQLTQAIRNVYIAPSASRDLDAQNIAAEYARLAARPVEEEPK